MAKVAPKPRGGLAFKAGLWLLLICLAIGLLSGGASWIDYFAQTVDSTPTPTIPAEETLTKD